MRKNLQIGWTLVFMLLCAGTLSAQRDTIAYWGFNAGTADYLYWYSDDEVGTRAYALNEYQDKKDATFGAFREGVREGEPISFYEPNHTMGTTTVLGTNCIAQQTWQRDDEMGKSDRYWLLNFSTTGATDITVSLYLTCAGTGGPGKAKFGYKIGDGEWIEDAEFKDIRGNVTASANFVGTDPKDLWTHSLPAACNDQASVSCRWLANDVRVDGTTAIAASSYSRVDDVTVTGIKSSSGIRKESPVSAAEITGSQLIAKENISVAVYNQMGAVVLNEVLSQGASITLPQGFQVIRISSSQGTEVIKRIVL